jgi:hypothetical protein
MRARPSGSTRMGDSIVIPVCYSRHRQVDEVRWRRCLERQAVRYTRFNDGSDQCTTGAQSALPLRLGPQIQALLSREGRPAGGCRTGQRRSRSGCSIVGSGCAGSHASPKTQDGAALEGDHVSRLRPAHADAPQGRRRLVALNIRPTASRVIPPSEVLAAAGEWRWLAVRVSRGGSRANGRRIDWRDRPALLRSARRADGVSKRPRR